MLKSGKSNNKNLKDINRQNKERREKENLEELDEEYNDINYYTQKDIEEEKDIDLIEKLRDVYKMENVDEEIIRTMKEFTFPKKFRELTREITGKTCQELLGISAGTFSKFKKGDTFPSDSTIKKLAKKLSVSQEYLLGQTEYTIPKVEEINKMTGLSEKALKIFFMLNHNIGECKELTDNVPVSNQNIEKLNVLNSFIEDNVKFLKFLSCLEQYSKLKDKLKDKIKEEAQEEIFLDNSSEDIKLQLLGLKGSIISVLFDFLDNM